MDELLQLFASRLIAKNINPEEYKSHVGIVKSVPFFQKMNNHVTSMREVYLRFQSAKVDDITAIDELDSIKNDCSYQALTRVKRYSGRADLEHTKSRDRREVFEFLYTTTPFDNETAGEYASDLENSLNEVNDDKALDELQEKVFTFDRLQSNLMLEILDTSEYQAARIESRKFKLNQKRLKFIRHTYRREELKRIDAVLELCQRANELYSYTLRLAEIIEEKITFNSM